MHLMDLCGRMLAALGLPHAPIEFYPFLFVVAILLSVLAPSLWRREYVRTLLAVAFGWSIFCFAAYPFHYFWLPSFKDHVEPTIVETARLFGRGMPIYHDADSASRYAGIYGPNTYLVQRGAMLLFGESMTTFKLPGVFLALASLVLVIAALRTVKDSVSFRLGMIYFCGMTMLHRDIYFFVRCDPQALFWTAFALFGATRRSRAVAAVLLGTAIGACCNLKIHYLLLFAPLAAVALPRATVRYGLITLGTAVVLFILPFALFANISPTNYLTWLALAGRHGFGTTEFMDVVTNAGMVALPLAVQAARMLHSWPDAERNRFLKNNFPGILLGGGGILLLMLLASKHGAGGWHLMPLLPTFAFLYASAHAHTRPAADNQRDLLGEACQASFVGLSIFSTSIAILLGALSVARPTELKDRLIAAAKDVRDFSAAHVHETVAMGYGGDDGYDLTFLRCLMPIEDKFVVDPVVLMDMSLAKVPLPHATLEKLSNGTVKRWLVPRGEEPFSMESYYYPLPLFSDEFRRTFREHYKLSGHTRYFDVWSYAAAEP